MFGRKKTKVDDKSEKEKTPEKPVVKNQEPVTTKTQESGAKPVYSKKPGIVEPITEVKLATEVKPAPSEPLESKVKVTFGGDKQKLGKDKTEPVVEKEEPPKYVPKDVIELIEITGRDLSMKYMHYPGTSWESGLSKDLANVKISLSSFL